MLPENNETIQVLKGREPLSQVLEEREMLALLEEALKIWNEMESELVVKEFKSEKEKRDHLKKCFNGEIKFPWHAQGQSIKITDNKVVKAAIAAGGIGILGGTATGRPEYEKDMNEREKLPKKEIRIDIGKDCNKDAILREIKEVRKAHPYAILGVNVLYAIGDFEEIVRALGEVGKKNKKGEVIEGGVDILYVGAGLPYDLSEIMAGKEFKHMRYMAIVSSAQAVNLLEDTSERSRSKGPRRPDGYVYEHKVAAGHNAKINPRKDKSAEEHIKEMKEVIGYKKDGKTLNKPIIFAGGVKYVEDAQKALLPEEYGGMGLNGVGLGTRVVITDESPIPNETLKSVHLNAAIDVIRREIFSTTRLPSTGKINEKEFWAKVAEVTIPTKKRCNDCLIKDEIRKKYPQLAHCPFMSNKEADIDLKFCLGFFLDAAIKGEPWGIYFMSAINEQDPITRIKREKFEFLR